MEKKKAEYLLAAVTLLILMGFVSLGLGNTSVDETIGKCVIETASCLLGSLYLTFLLSRFREKEWKEKRSKKAIRFLSLCGIGLFAGRQLSRFLYWICARNGKQGMGFAFSIISDLVWFVLIYMMMPRILKKKEGDETEAEEYV